MFPETRYFSAGVVHTEDNNKLVKDKITLNGDDWTFNQHIKIDTTPTEDDFRKTVADYLAWQVSNLLNGDK